MNSNWSYSLETVNCGQNWRFLPSVSFIFDRWPWKTIGHLFYATSGFVHHLIAIGEFKLELQSGNTQFGSKSTIFQILWPWNLTDYLEKKIRHFFYATSSFEHHFIVIGEFKLKLQSGNAQFGSKSTIFRDVWPWNLTDDLETQQGTSPKQHQALCIISSPYVDSTWSYGPETAKWGFDFCDLEFWPLTLTFCTSLLSMVITPEKFMMIRWREHSEKGVTNRWTDGRTEPFIELELELELIYFT